jgi:transcriptional regulator with PAS, ATPase and Fis domain
MSKVDLEVSSLLDSHETPAVLIDHEYKVVAANAAYRKAYGLSADQLAGLRCHKISHRSDVPCHLKGELCPHREVFARQEKVEVMHTHFDLKGRPDYVRIKAYPIRTKTGEPLLLEVINRLAMPEVARGQRYDMVGRTPAFLASLATLAAAARSDVPLLIEGESGVGKEVAARHVHVRSARADKPFVEVNCAAIPESLCESEMFGHEKGAFTGSLGRRDGIFAQANGGTLFLDEIGEMPPAMQAKLLRILDTGELRPLGAQKATHVNVRLIAATNRNLARMVEEGTFRRDLYFRIGGLKVSLPPLRGRKADIGILAQCMLDKLAERGHERSFLTTEALHRLEQHDYPGNVRELKNILERALALSEDSIIRPEHLLLDDAQPGLYAPQETAGDNTLGLTMGEIERGQIDKLLRKYDGNRRMVANALGISERTLYRRLRDYQVAQSGASAMR